MPKKRVMLVGWDAADWKVIRPLLQAGQMPNLARLVAGGVHGNLATIYPALSPMLWTSIATGKRAYKHGIHGFSEPLADASGVRPITLLSRKTKAVWNILNQTGHRSIVVGWWPSHPAEPIDGVMVSNLFAQPFAKRSFLAGTIHPETLAQHLMDLRVEPTELTGEFMRLFVPGFEQVDQSADKRLHSLGKIISETMTVHAVATDLLATQPWDFAAIYYSGIDHFGHGFMRYYPPQLPWVRDEDFRIYSDVISNAYRYHDAMLGRLLAFADENTTIILMSDHGFHPDHLRPAYIPAEPAGPAVEHRHFGVLCLKGPGLRSNENIYGASLLDICPTILTLFGLPPGKDMDGKVLVTAFTESPRVEPIESWDAIAGAAGTHSVETRLDPVASAEAFKQLVELGYVAPPGPNVQETIDECVRELKYNLSRAYRDGNCFGEAASLAEQLWARWPKEHRFGILLIECLGPLRRSVERRQAIEQLGRRVEQYQAEAKLELATREEASRSRDKTEAEEKPAFGQTREQYEERQLRELANGRPLLLEWFEVSQALLEKRPDEARRHLEKLTNAEGLSERLSQRVAGALAELGDHDKARSLLETALQFDPENPFVQSQLAGIYFQASRFHEAIAAATESLSLLYFQPGIHALLGQALMETSRFEEAEKALRVAVSQSPRNLVAHESLAKLYRSHLDRPTDAFAQEGRARSLRHELAKQKQAVLEENSNSPAPSPRSGHENGPESLRVSEPHPHSGRQEHEAPKHLDVHPEKIITVVSGLPRSGTSMMMQLLKAAGRTVLTDEKRTPDEDNPLGYLEFEKTLTLTRDSSWLPEARGKVVKIVAQLLPSLPPGEHYHIVLMDRDLKEVIASQKAMLTRQHRQGAELDERTLVETYASQMRRVLTRLGRRPEIRILSINYADLLSDPAGGVARIASFLGPPFDVEASIESIRPELRRQKS
jgi:predicted AlkP superfamily phosphohydrolase/phosphomutase/tetratricopeptide (TPR) repeat protein